ncbi:Cyclic nucleotide-binding domain protein [Candidatus Magnetoovum chiemensis]|nr:Cyclic nucleotide-binding domain protein [Candidatus Magnetoovum chiemensis]
MVKEIIAAGSEYPAHLFAQIYKRLKENDINSALEIIISMFKTNPSKYLKDIGAILNSIDNKTVLLEIVKEIELLTLKNGETIEAQNNSALYLIASGSVYITLEPAHKNSAYLTPLCILNNRANSLLHNNTAIADCLEQGDFFGEKTFYIANKQERFIILGLNDAELIKIKAETIEKLTAVNNSIKHSAYNSYKAQIEEITRKLEKASAVRLERICDISASIKRQNDKITIEDTDAFLIKEPDNPLIYLKKAHLLLNDKMPKEAAEACIKAGSIFELNNINSKALAIYKAASRLDPFNIETAKPYETLFSAHPARTKAVEEFSPPGSRLFLSLMFPEDIKFMFDNAKILSFSDGSSIINRQDDKTPCAYVIKTGTATINTTVNSRAIPYIELKTGNIFGGLDMFAESKSAAASTTTSITAKGSVLVYEIDIELLTAILRKNPLILLYLDEPFNECLEDTIARLCCL